MNTQFKNLAIDFSGYVLKVVANVLDFPYELDHHFPITIKDPLSLGFKTQRLLQQFLIANKL